MIQIRRLFTAPIIPFRVISDQGDAVLYGLLDTGADETLLPMAIAEVLGVNLDPRNRGTVLSASGEMSVVYGDISLEIGRGRARYRWHTTVGFLSQPLEEALLGHRGFLQYFDVSFLWVRKEIRLHRNAEPFSKS